MKIVREMISDVSDDFELFFMRFRSKINPQFVFLFFIFEFLHKMKIKILSSTGSFTIWFILANGIFFLSKIQTRTAAIHRIRSWEHLI